MLIEIAAIFINVITPVFGLVVIGYVAGPRLGLEARTLSRYAYFILIPAFIFNIVSTANMQALLTVKMILFITLVHVGCALLALLVGWLLRRSAQMISAYIVIATFGNVGNFGLPIIEFHLGDEALFPATIYFLAIIVIAFVISVAAASWTSGGTFGAALAVFKTPALIALVPALTVNVLQLEPPLFLSRITGLLGAAMVPTMLVTLGVQLAAVQHLKLDVDVLISSAVRLIGGPTLALLIIIPFALTGVERGAGIFQASMPTAVLALIIAMEYDLIPDFVTTVVLFSTLASTVTLTLLLAIV